MATTPQERAGAVLVIAGALFIALATLAPAAGPEVPRAPFCILCGELGTVDFILNLALFVPLGAGLRLAGLGRRHALAAILGSTLLVELLQLKIVAGRDASLGDLLANTIGGLVGVYLADHWRGLILPRPTNARKLAVLTGVLCVAVLALTAWGLGRSIPDGRYWGQWRRLPGSPLRFGGVVLGAELNGHPLRPNLLQWDDPAIDAIRADTLTLAATIQTGPATRRVASIASVGADPSHRLIVLAQRGDDFVFRIRLRASELRLRSPSFGIPRVLSKRDNGGDDSLRLEGRYAPDRVSLRADGSVTTVPLTVGMGWSFVMPVELALGRWAAVISAVWLAVLFTPITYWAATGWRGAGGVLVPLLIAAVGLLALPLGSPISTTSPIEWLGTAVGVSAGLLLARRLSGEPVTNG